MRKLELPELGIGFSELLIHDVHVKNSCLYLPRMNLPVTTDITRMIQPVNGCTIVAMDVEELALGGLSPKTVVLPEAGLLVLNTVGEAEPGTVAPDDEVVDGAGVVVVGVGVVVVGVGVVVVGVGVVGVVIVGDDDEDEDDG